MDIEQQIDIVINRIKDVKTEEDLKRVKSALNSIKMFDDDKIFDKIIFRKYITSNLKIVGLTKRLDRAIGILDSIVWLSAIIGSIVIGYYIFSFYPNEDRITAPEWTILFTFIPYVLLFIYIHFKSIYIDTPY